MARISNPWVTDTTIGFGDAVLDPIPSPLKSSGPDKEYKDDPTQHGSLTLIMPC